MVQMILLIYIENSKSVMYLFSNAQREYAGLKNRF